MSTEASAEKLAAEREPGAARRLLTALLLGLAIIVPPLVLIPLEIHADNAYEFSVAAPDLLSSLLLTALVPVVSITCCVAILPPRYYAVMTTVLLAVALLVWIQGQLIVPDYGVLDGGKLATAGNPGSVVLAALSWTALLIGAFLARRKLWRWAGPVALSLLVIQAVPAARAMLQRPSVPEFHRYTLDNRQAFSFSAERNVIVIVFDAFQADVFGRLLMDEPELRQELSGFTWFRNALAGYSKTYPSLALMLTGRWYDNEVPIQEFIKHSFMEQSIPGELLSRGWRVELLPRLKRVVYPTPEVASNARLALPCSERLADAGRAMDLGLFRVSPQWWKSWWINDYRWRLGGWLPQWCGGEEENAAHIRKMSGEHHALAFLRRADNEAAAGWDEPVFRLYHLMMPHAPFMLDESLSQQKLPADEEGFRRHSRATLNVLKRFLSLMKARGFYDNSLILVVADHGGGEYIDSVDTSALSPATEMDGDSAIPGRHLASGLPLVLVKPPGERGDLSVSDAPVSLADVAATVAGRLRLDEQFPGRDMFAVDAGARRERRYRFYSFDGWSGDYLPEMIEYSVEGHSWLPENWKPSGRRLAPSATARVPESHPYRLGERVRFRAGSFPENFLVSGWSRPSSEGMVWSRAGEARLRLPLSEPADGALRVRLDYLPYDAAGALPSPRVRLGVNGALQKEWRESGRGWREFCLPAAIAEQTKVLDLQFELPDAASPADLGRGPDARQLGIALYQLEVLRCKEQEG